MRIKIINSSLAVTLIRSPINYHVLYYKLQPGFDLSMMPSTMILTIMYFNGAET